MTAFSILPVKYSACLVESKGYLRVAQGVWKTADTTSQRHNVFGWQLVLSERYSAWLDDSWCYLRETQRDWRLDDSWYHLRETRCDWMTAGTTWERISVIGWQLILPNRGSACFDGSWSYLIVTQRVWMTAGTTWERLSEFRRQLILPERGSAC